MDRKSAVYIAAATANSLLFGEILGPLLAGHPLPLLRYPLAFLVYYAVLSAIFSVIVRRSVPLALAAFFAYGAAAELLLFHTIRGIADLPGILFFGLFYVFLFGAPVPLSRWIAARFPVRGA